MGWPSFIKNVKISQTNLLSTFCFIAHIHKADANSKSDGKEQWIVNNVKINKDIKSILKGFNGVQPSFTATASAPQAQQAPSQQKQQQQQPAAPASPAAPAASPQQQAASPVHRATFHAAQGQQQQQQQLQQQQQQQLQLQQQFNQQAAAHLIPNGANDFLKQGVGSRLRLMGALPSQPSGAQGGVSPIRQPCLASCAAQCSASCDPNCCRSGLTQPDDKKDSGAGTLTAEILPIPDHLNKALEEAGIGPGATAQILPTKENLKILKDAGYGTGVTAQVVPIPADIEVVGGDINVDSRSGGSKASPQVLASFPQLSGIVSPQKAVSARPQAPAAALVQTPAQQVAAAAAAMATVQQSPHQQQQQAAAMYKDPTYLDIISRSDSPTPNKQADQQQAPATPAPPPQPVAPKDLGPKVEELPLGQTNYDQDSYKQILAELPPSVAPDQPIASVLSEQKQQLKGIHPVHMFFSEKSNQDPLVNLEAYKKQEFKDINSDDDR